MSSDWIVTLLLGLVGGGGLGYYLRPWIEPASYSRLQRKKAERLHLCHIWKEMFAAMHEHQVFLLNSVSGFMDREWFTHDHNVNALGNHATLAGVYFKSQDYDAEGFETAAREMWDIMDDQIKRLYRVERLTEQDIFKFQEQEKVLLRAVRRHLGSYLPEALIPVELLDWKRPDKKIYSL